MNLWAGTIGKLIVWVSPNMPWNQSFILWYYIHQAKWSMPVIPEGEAERSRLTSATWWVRTQPQLDTISEKKESSHIVMLKCFRKHKLIQGGTQAFPSQNTGLVSGSKLHRWPAAFGRSLKVTYLEGGKLAAWPGLLLSVRSYYTGCKVKKCPSQWAAVFTHRGAALGG